MEFNDIIDCIPVKPYYKDKQSDIVIYCCDNRLILPKIPDKSIDLVFADPPFNVGKDYGELKDCREDYYEWCKLWVDSCFDIMADTASIYIMLISRHLGKFYPMLENRGTFINEVHWRNVSACHSKRSFWSSFQPILVYGKTKEYLFNTYALRRVIKEENLRWGGYSTAPQGQYLDYWDDIPFIYAGAVHHEEAILKPNTNQKAHPCQMPVDLSSRAVVFSSNENSIVMDPFLGIGATALSCKKLKRKCIGIELNKEYAEIAVKRLAQGLLI